MDDLFQTRPSDTALRRVFNRQRYIESIVGLLTRRRLPFSAAEWDEMRAIILASNPAIEDLFLRLVMRLCVISPLLPTYTGLN
jgi:hypothetical protein